MNNEKSPTPEKLNKPKEESEKSDKNLERILTPEVIEKIMEKVQNIDKKGTAFSALWGYGHYLTRLGEIPKKDKKNADYHGEIIKKILTAGLLAHPKSGDSLKGKMTKQKWAELARGRKDIYVYGNIVGRMGKIRGKAEEDPEYEAYRKARFGEEGKSDIGRLANYFGNLGVIFDISSYKERYGSVPLTGTRQYAMDLTHVESAAQEIMKDMEIKEGDTLTPEIRKEFMKEAQNYANYYYNNRFYDMDMDDETKERAIQEFTEDIANYGDPEFGFRLRHRVPPHLFRGVIFRAHRPRTNEEKKVILDYTAKHTPWVLDTTKKDLLEEDNIKTLNPAACEAIAKKLVSLQMQIYKDKPQLLLPIYDTDGNMWWPKQMSYEEIKKFVAERDTEKKEEEKKDS